VVIVYDVTQDGKSNNAFSWYEESAKHCPENAIKIFIGNKIDLYDEINIKNINALDEHSWKAIASEKIRSYQVSCKNYEGIEEFWAIME
jgi:GTPase SAR1 family protein